MSTAVAVGSDDAGAALRRAIVDHLGATGVNVVDVGYDDERLAYPQIALQVAERVRTGEFARAILVCGTGIGMAIAANKVPGVYAAQAHDTYSAERARKSNNAQIMTLGARVVGEQLALAIVDAWMASEFEGGRSAPKVALIADAEARHAKAHQ